MGATANPFLGRHFNSAHPAETQFWEVTLDRGTLPYLDDHRIEGAAVLPASVYVEMALAAAAEAFPSQAFVLRDIEFHRALFLPDGGTRTIQVILSPDADGTASVHIYSCPRDEEPTHSSWTLHATGRICPQPNHGISSVVEQGTLTEIQARCIEHISGRRLLPEAK